MEQFWFSNALDATEFFSDANRQRVLSKLPPSFDSKASIQVVGNEAVVFDKDI
jgi:hypothetical protein